MKKRYRINKTDRKLIKAGKRMITISNLFRSFKKEIRKIVTAV